MHLKNVIAGLENQILLNKKENEVLFRENESLVRENDSLRARG
jgi:hypothetical protein